MPANNVYPNPFVRTVDTTPRVMADVVIALLPAVIMAYVAFGTAVLSLIAVAVGSALIAEYVFSVLFSGRADALPDGSAIVTGLLLSFTLGGFTPLPAVAFGAAAAVVFGKLLWGGLGCNVFNPALVGREMMTVFFPAAMTSGAIWYNPAAVSHASIALFGNSVMDELFFHPSGAVGEYSALALVVGGLYLLWRRRITWHVPFSLMLVFFVAFTVLRNCGGEDMNFSLGGLLLGATFMATDMPTSPCTAVGKCYYGGMIGLIAALLIFGGVHYEYMSYSILLLNGAAPFIGRCFKPRMWGARADWGRTALYAAGLTIVLLAVTFVISTPLFAKLHAVQYLVYVFILWTVVLFAMNNFRELKEAGRGHI